MLDEILAIEHARLDSQIGTRVARKVLDTQQEQGEAMVQLIQAAAEVQDAAQAGGGLDLYA